MRKCRLACSPRDPFETSAFRIASASLLDDMPHTGASLGNRHELMLVNPRAELPLVGRLGKPLPPDEHRRAGGRLSEAPAGLCPTGRPMPTPVQRGRFRKLVTKRALWHSGGPIRRAGGPRDSRDLGFPRARGARRAERRPRACHRARFVTNLRAAPRRAASGGPCQRWPNREASAFRLCGKTPRKNAYESAFVSLESNVPRAIRCARRVSLPRKARARR